jgi:hypothetical protein
MTDQAERNVAEELTAIKAVADALQPLSDAGRRHVIAYVAEALGVGPAPTQTVPQAPQQVLSTGLSNAVTAGEPESRLAQPIDIRSLKEGAVGFSVPDAAMELALKGPHLVTQDHKLDVLVSSATPGRGHER